MANIVTVQALAKSYGKKEVLKEVCFEINSGQIVGLLGPNGIGKSTIIKVLCGLLEGYTGKVEIQGQKPGAFTKGEVSYLPEKTYLPNWMRVKDAIAVFQDFYTDFNIDKAVSMLSAFDLSQDMKIKTMSKGMQEKLQIMLVMSRQAKLYILDEPLGGVDPLGRDYILETILSNYSEKSAVLLSTHLISDVERIFDKVLFLKDGRIAIDEQVDTLRDTRGKSIDELFREVYK